jgi:hypothetical protein
MTEAPGGLILSSHEKARASDLMKLGKNYDTYIQTLTDLVM